MRSELAIFASRCMAIVISMDRSVYEIVDAERLHARTPGFLFYCVWETCEDVNEPQQKPVELHSASRRISED